MAEIFGWRIERRGSDFTAPPTFSREENDDGASEIAASGAWNAIVTQPLGQQAEGGIKTEAELILRYRDMALYPDIDAAIDQIVNEAIVGDDEKPITLNLEALEIPDNIKKLMEEEFEEILNLYNFHHKGFNIFRNWYIDGRIYYQLIIDDKNPDEGIKEVRYIDSTKIKKVKEYEKTKQKGLVVSKVKAEYYVYSEKGFTQSRPGLQVDSSNQGVKIHPDSIVMCGSGLTDPARSMVISYLHKAIRTLGQLKNMEDSMVIYRISRAPERRVFYIDVGTLPPAKAEQYMQKMMTKFKNKITYDSATGEVKSDRKFASILEDFWLPRRGERGTEITTLPGGPGLSDMGDVNYFQQKLYQALNIPVTRLDPQNMVTLGRASELTRDELMFQKFIDRLRARFSRLFSETLGRQLILKNVLTPEDWKQIQNKIVFKYARDNFAAELKDIEILQERINLLDRISQYEGRYFSRDWIRKNVLFQDETEIEDMEKEIEEEKVLYADEYAAGQGDQPDGVSPPQ